MATYNEILNEMLDSTGLDEKDVIELYKMFFDLIFDDIKQINKALSTDDFIFVKKKAHQLKGSSGNLYIMELSELSLQLEIAANNQNKSLCIEIANLMVLKANQLHELFIF